MCRCCSSCEPGFSCPESLLFADVCDCPQCGRELNHAKRPEQPPQCSRHASPYQCAGRSSQLRHQQLQSARSDVSSAAQRDGGSKRSASSHTRTNSATAAPQHASTSELVCERPVHVREATIRPELDSAVPAVLVSSSFRCDIRHNSDLCTLAVPFLWLLAMDHPHHPIHPGSSPTPPFSTLSASDQIGIPPPPSYVPPNPIVAPADPLLPPS